MQAVSYSLAHCYRELRLFDKAVTLFLSVNDFESLRISKARHPCRVPLGSLEPQTSRLSLCCAHQAHTCPARRRSSHCAASRHVFSPSICASRPWALGRRVTWWWSWRRAMEAWATSSARRSCGTLPARRATLQLHSPPLHRPISFFHKASHTSRGCCCRPVHQECALEAFDKAPLLSNGRSRRCGRSIWPSWPGPISSSERPPPPSPA